MFKKIDKASAKPVVWSHYTADVLWTDSHIAKQMLTFHLNPELSLASRTAEFIDASVNWLVSEFNLNADSKTIDFGCGPGLYTQRLKSRGVGTVVGLDFSLNSLKHARDQAKKSQLDIEYHYGNYLDYSDVRQFDLITLVMCDLCALNPVQRATLLGKFKSMLSPSGSIALDVYTTTRFAAQTEFRNLEKNAMAGFWSVGDYWCLQSNFKYEPEMVTLDKYVIFEDAQEWTVYNWLQHFDLEMLARELKPHGLEIKAKYSDLKGSSFTVGEEMALVISHE